MRFLSTCEREPFQLALSRCLHMMSFFEGISCGKVCKGHVKNITDFGAFIDLGGIDGLLHITNMSWVPIKHPSEMITIGQELDVMVLEVDQEKERISLGLKQMTANPWDSMADRYPVGSRVKGKVVHLAKYGAFVEITPGIQGLVHVSEFSWQCKPTDARESFKMRLQA